jgi:type VI secretion system protein ImpJ
MQVCELPSEARRARQVYWLVQKARIGDTLKLEQLKLAGPERLAAVHQLALRGVPFRPILSPPFHHNFTAEVDFYALERGEEWDHALREGKLAFYSKKELEGVRSFIYWRND